MSIIENITTKYFCDLCGEEGHSSYKAHYSDGRGGVEEDDLCSKHYKEWLRHSALFFKSKRRRNGMKKTRENN